MKITILELVFLVACASFLLAPAPSHASPSLDSARELVITGKIGDAISLYRQLANDNDHTAQAELATLLLNPHSYPPDFKEACTYALKSHNAGVTDGTFSLAFCHLYGRAGFSDFEEGKQLIIESLNNKHFKSVWAIRSFELGLEDEMAKAIPAMRSEALHLIDTDSDPISIFEAARFLESIEENDSAKKGILKAASLGYAPAIYQQASLARSAEDFHSMRSLICEAAIKQYWWAIYHYLFHPSTQAESWSCFESEKEQKSFVKNSLTLFEEGVLAFWKGKSYLLVEPYRVGNVSLQIAADNQKTFLHANICSHHQGISQERRAWCQNWLGIYYGNGTGVKRDSTRALNLYHEAHKGGDIWASANIAEAYEEGKGVEVDFDQAMEWFRKSLDLGNYGAHMDIGRLLENGLTGEQDYSGAAQHYESAIEKDGDPRAMLNLASLIESQLVDGSLEYALGLYKLAMEKNYSYETTTVGEIEKSYRAIAKVRLDALTKKLASQNLGSINGLSPGNYYSLLIGANEYQFLTPLETPIRDIRDLGEILEQEYGFTNFILENPKREDILKALGQLRKTLSESDNLLIYYAGHGTIDEDAGFGFWQTVEAEADADYDWIPTDRITRSLRGFKSKNVMVVSDSCYSGTMLRSGSAMAAKYNDFAGVQALIEKKTRMAISSGGLEPVTDSLAGARNSVFANQLILSLESAGSIVSSTELFSRLQSGVVGVSTRLGITQTPEIAPLYESGHEGGDFFFVRKSND